jgi:ketosteroid isomerase-like protein
MPAENVELVRRAFEAAVRLPRPDFATVNALVHPDFEMVTRMSQLEGTSFIGAAGFGAWQRGRDEHFEAPRFRLERIAELDEHRVVVASRFTAKAKRSGPPIDQVQGVVVTVRDEMVTRMETYASVDEALAAAGD